MRGHVVSNRYTYPEGYLSKGLGALDGDDRDQVRLASIMRTGGLHEHETEAA